MTRSILLLFTLLSVAGAARPQAALQAPYTGTNQNWVRAWSATAPQQNPASLVLGPLTDVKQQTQYFDGLGRPTQMVAKQASPLGNDMVFANCYDPSTQKELLKYLPFTANAAQSGDVTNDGNFKADRFQEQVAFYNSFLNGQPNETNTGSNSLNWAYSQTNYEASPLNRTLNTFAPGVSWVGSASGTTQHDVQQASWVNTAADSVQIWNIPTIKSVSQVLPQAQIIPANGGTYAPGALFKMVVTDEQGYQTITFKDQYGQVILKKVQNGAGSDNETGSGHPGWLCTYYAYDDYGNLRFIIPPNVVELIDGNWNSITQSYVDELCYYFEYDNLDRMVIKKTPGAPTGVLGEVWMVYDERDRLVMQQDGYLRSQQKWKYTQYDGLDRITGTGFLTDPASNTTNYTDLNTQLNAAAGSITWPVLSSYATESLTQVFYDNYNWMSSANSSTLSNSLNATTNGTANTAFTTSYGAAPNYALQIIQSKMTRGLVIGTKAEVLGSSQGQYLYSISFYDSKARVIQIQKINYLQGTDIQTTQYGWDGKVLAKVVAHAITNSANPQSHLVATTMTYDVMDRLQTISKTISSTIGSTPVGPYSTTIRTNQYNELSELQKKTLGNNLESLTYDYNVRGWLLGENRNYISGASTSNHFALELGYDKTSSVAPGNTYLAAAYNGNITGAVWKSAGDGINRKYDYSYDPINRLTAAKFSQYNGSSFDISAGIDFSVSNLGYDANGNIGSMQQNGFLLGGSQTIDNLTYSYVNGKNAATGANYSNRLLNTMDAGNNPNSTLGDFHYPSSKPTGNTDYTYDANGNITSDYNRSIASISYYSDMNLPNTVTVTGKGTVQYLYDAAGNRLSKQTIQTNASVPYNGANYNTTITTTTKYVDGFVYQTVNYSNASLAPLNANNTDVLQFTGHEEGRIRFKAAVGAVAASFVFDYFIRDNLDNVRVALTDEVGTDTYPAATLETTSYDGGVAEAVESLYYTINTADIKTTATQLPWFAGDGGTGYANNNGTPANPDSYSNQTINSANVYWLNGQTGDKTGLGITLKVMAGDQLSIFGKSIWHNTGTVASNIYLLSNTLLSYFGSFAASPAVIARGEGVVTASSLSTNSVTTTALTTMLNGTPTQTQNTEYAPKAAINWILFDDQFKPVNMGTTLVNSQPDVMTTHSFPLNIQMTKDGYVYVYCSNESNIDVYFDNLQVTLAHGPMLEETHYYPYGLTMAAISDRAFGKQQNFYHYQGNEMQNQEWNDGTGLEEYDFHARTYDQQLGVWHNQDPIMNSASPYAAMAGNPAFFTDENGKCPICVVLIVAAVVGGTLDDMANKENIHNFWQGLGYFAAGAIEADATVLGDASASSLTVLQATGWFGSALAAFGSFAGASGFADPSVGAILSGSFTPISFAVSGAAQILADGPTVGFKNLNFGQYIGDFIAGGLNGMTAESYASLGTSILGLAKAPPGGALFNSSFPQYFSNDAANTPVENGLATIFQGFSRADFASGIFKADLGTFAKDLRYGKGKFSSPLSYLESGIEGGLSSWGGDAGAGIIKVPNLGSDILLYFLNSMEVISATPHVPVP